MILAMRAEMLGQVLDSLSEHRNLYLRRAGIFLVLPVFLDDLRSLIWQQSCTHVLLYPMLTIKYAQSIIIYVYP